MSATLPSAHVYMEQTRRRRRETYEEYRHKDSSTKKQEYLYYYKHVVTNRQVGAIVKKCPKCPSVE